MVGHIGIRSDYMGAEHIHLYRDYTLAEVCCGMGRALRNVSPIHLIVVRVLSPQLERRSQIPHLTNELSRRLPRSIG